MMNVYKAFHKSLGSLMLAFATISFSQIYSDETQANSQNAQTESALDRASIQLTTPLPPQWINDLSFQLDTQSASPSKFPYKVAIGSIPVKCREEKSSADISYIAYFKDIENALKTETQRPVVFCFNGGPSSSSVWLHLGGLAPKRVNIQDINWQSKPVTVIDNPHNLLTVADLVFVDPVSTGFSQAETSSDQMKFFGVDEDIDSLAQFISRFIGQFNLWQSDKYLIGESYGAVRVTGIAAKLIDRYMITCQGIALISGTIDYRDIESPDLGDLSAITPLPTFAALARYHNKLDQKQLNQPLHDFLQEVETFCIKEYCPSILIGDMLSMQRKEKLAEKMASYIGLSKETILENNLRISPYFFALNLMKEKKQLIGRFDGRYLGAKIPGQEYAWNDPSLFAVGPAFVTALNSYLTTDLKAIAAKTKPYEIFSSKANPSTWNWQRPNTPPGLGYCSVVADARLTLAQNPDMKLFVASGIYDLALPFFGQELNIHRLLLSPEVRNNITMKRYFGGHMMYLVPSTRQKLISDLAKFIETPPLKIETTQTIHPDELALTAAESDR